MYNVFILKVKYTDAYLQVNIGSPLFEHYAVV